MFTCVECPTCHSDSKCVAYQNSAIIEEFRIEYFEDTGTASPSTYTQLPRKGRKLLTDSQGSYDYYSKISDKQQIKDVIKTDFSGLTGVASREGLPAEKKGWERMRMFLLCATETFTMPLTILAALENLSLTKPELKIHLLGAPGREIRALSDFEETSHLMPDLRSLQITLVGPSVWKHGEDESSPCSPAVSLNCCPVCTSDGRSRIVASYTGLYHDFMTINDYSKPDLTVFVNSGWVDGDDAETHWLPTIEMLVDSDVPSLFTAYNGEEALNEKAKMREMGARFVVEPEKNKWSGLVLTPDFLAAEYDIWLQNAY
jgi:splicing suppressor protein 51